MLENRVSSTPRGPRHGSPSTRVGGASRGGIRKRPSGPPTRIDKDGDLVMDAGAAAKSGRGRHETGRGRGAGRGRGGSVRGSTRGSAILRGIGAKQANILDSRSLSNGTLKVDGLRESKAAKNADGGLESLLGFLERKAAAHDVDPNRAVKIKKVCLLI